MEVAIVNGTIIILVCSYLIANLYRVEIIGGAAALVFFSLAAYLVIIPTSMSVGVLHGVDVSFRDIVELHKPILYLITFFSLSFFLSNSYSAPYALHRFFLLAVIILSVFAILHFSRISDLVLNLYTKSHNIRSYRVSAPFVNPYDYAYFTAFLATYFLVLSFNRSFKYIALFVLAVILISLTQSRSVFFPFIFFVLTASGFALFLSNYSQLSRFNIRIRYLFIGFVMLALLMSLALYLYIFFEEYEYLVSGLLHMINSGELGSATTRIVQFETAVQLGTSNILLFIFGHGPAKNIMEHVESAYAFYIFRYGVSGLLFGFIIPYLVCLYSLLIKITRKRKEKESIDLYLACFIFMLLVPVFSIGNNFNEQMRLSIFYILILAIGTRRLPS
ncbi:hypothetical protein [Pseudidiomarina planktonica]|nr:hypothetical protein [Pseudidiomarina planktonica]RUO65936.1 hypothetical protein CWI77_05765 [Pseudidiomarina planktonica]